MRGIKLGLQCKHPEFRPSEAGPGTCLCRPDRPARLEVHSGGLNQVFWSAESALGGEGGLIPF